MKTVAEITQSAEDYCFDVGNHLGLCRLRGASDKQQDAIAYNEKDNTVFQSLSFDNKVGLLERVVEEHQDQNRGYERSGSTLLCSFNSHNLQTNIFRTQLVNIGDGSHYLVILNADHSVFELTRLNLLHNPDPKKNIDEYNRVQRVKKIIKEDTYRLSGPKPYCLMVSRTIADNAAKPFGLSHIPDIYEATRILHPGQSAMTISASDGLEVLSIETMKSIISRWAHSKQTLCYLAHCLAITAYKQGSHDNISVGIIREFGSVLIADGHGKQGEQVANNVASTFYSILDSYSPRMSESGGFAAPFYSKFFTKSRPEDDITYFLKIALTWMLKIWLYDNKVELGVVETWLNDTKKIKEFTDQLALDPCFFVWVESSRKLRKEQAHAMPISFFIDNTCLNFTTAVFLQAWHKTNQQEQSRLITLAISQFQVLFRKDLNEITHKALLINDMIKRIKTSITVPEKKRSTRSMIKMFFTTKQAAFFTPEETLLSSLTEHSQFNYLTLCHKGAQFATESRIRVLNDMLDNCKEKKREIFERERLQMLQLWPWDQRYNTPFTTEEHANFRQMKQNELDSAALGYEFISELGF